MTVKKSSWPQYVARFSRSARRQGYDDDYIAACLDYAQRLNIAGLPIIFDQQHFSLLAGYSLEYILGASNSPRDYYRKFEIPKKSGGNRTIFEPLPSLKEIQRWNLDEILSNIPINAASKAYEKGKSIKDNARFHVNRESVLSMDIKDFFPSISPGRVHHIFRSAGYSKAVATLLTALCSYGKSIPQGAPTSPYISNIICQPIDIRLFGFAKNNDLRYTRYADDMTFSGVLNAESIINFTRRVLSENRFSLNDKKTRLMHKNKRQHVTGVVVNEKTQVPIEIRKRLRQEIYYIEKFGLDEHLLWTKNLRANHLEHLMGFANHILHINPKDLEADRSLKFLREIRKKLLDSE